MRSTLRQLSSKENCQRFWLVQMCKIILIFILSLMGCSEFLNHPQYCHTHSDCLNGQYFPTIRAPKQSPNICRGKAIIYPMKLGD